MNTISLSRRNTSETTSHTHADQPSGLKAFAAGKLKDLSDLAASKLSGLPAYSFPVGELSHLSDSTASALTSELEALSGQIHTCSNADFLRYRKRICVLSIEMNLRGSISPKFRPQWDCALPKTARNRLKLRDMADAYARTRWNIQDRQVIDMHWVFVLNQCQVRSAAADGADDSRNLLWGAAFDFTRAAQYAAEQRGAGVKAKELGISLDMAIHLSWLQDDEMAAKWKNLLADGHAFERFVRDLAEHRPSLRGRSRAYKWIWITSQITEGAFGAMRDVYAFMTDHWIRAHDFRTDFRQVRSLALECFAD